MKIKTKAILIVIMTTVIVLWVLLGFVAADFNVWNWHPFIRALYAIGIILMLNNLFEK